MMKIFKQSGELSEEEQKNIYEEVYQLLLSVSPYARLREEERKKRLTEVKKYFENYPLEIFINGENKYKAKHEGLISRAIYSVSNLEQFKEIIDVIRKKEQGEKWLHNFVHNSGSLILYALLRPSKNDHGISFAAYLINELGISPDDEGRLEEDHNIMGGTALYCTVCGRDKSEPTKQVAKFLISSGSDIGYRKKKFQILDEKDKKQLKTVFDGAAPEIKELIRFEGLKYLFKLKKDDDDILRRIEFLLDNGANPGVKDENGNCLIDLAISSIRIAMLAYMNKCTRDSLQDKQVLGKENDDAGSVNILTNFNKNQKEQKKFNEKGSEKLKQKMQKVLDVEVRKVIIKGVLKITKLNDKGVIRQLMETILNDPDEKILKRAMSSLDNLSMHANEKVSLVFAEYLQAETNQKQRESLIEILTKLIKPINQSAFLNVLRVHFKEEMSSVVQEKISKVLNKFEPSKVDNSLLIKSIKTTPKEKYVFFFTKKNLEYPYAQLNEKKIETKKNK